jgi:hypothetical protein
MCHTRRVTGARAVLSGSNSTVALKNLPFNISNVEKTSHVEAPSPKITHFDQNRACINDFSVFSMFFFTRYVSVFRVTVKNRAGRQFQL